jgi:Ca2+-transporting ATPase
MRAVAAALVLLEDDFTAIVSAIRLGRRIFANLRQAMVYTLAVHIPLIGLSILPVMFGLPLILAPIHIAFLELVIDPACSIVFEAEAGGTRLMEQPPRSPAEPLVSLPQIVLSLGQGGLVPLVVAAFYWWILSTGTMAEEARASAFIVLVTANAVLILPCRSPDPGWRGMFAGLSSVGVAVLGGTLLGLTIITGIPAVAEAFAFRSPSVQQSLLAVTVGAGMLLLFEASKSAMRKHS